MKRSHSAGLLALGLSAMVVGAFPATAQQPAPAAPRPPQVTPGMPTIAWPTDVPAPRVTLAPGLGPAPDYAGVAVPLPPVKVPDGFTPIFNGRDLTGWHISKTSHHGHTPDFHVSQGVILGSQQPYGGGGLLVTDKKYRNYELYMEVRADWGSDSGVFLRTTEEGAAYQVTLDYLPGGSMGRVISEGGLVGVGRPLGQETAPAAPPAAAPGTPPAPDPGMSIWKHQEWNTVRVRVEGTNPHVMVWINDKLISDFTDPANRAVGGMVEGPFAIQVHGGNQRWQPGNFWRWRNIGVKELPAR